MSPEFVLETRGLTKEFRGFTAVDSVDLRVQKGHIHALIGPNGAGKTTVFNLLTKFLPPTRGEILYLGQPITRLKPNEIARLGLVRSFQISAVFGHMSVVENVRVALQRKRGDSYHFWKPESSLDSLNERAMQMLDEVGLLDYAHTQTIELPYGRKRALELATTLALDPSVLLLDEPTQGMGHEDVNMVIELVRRAAVGRTVLMVEHNLSVVSELSDRITVLARGAILAEGDYASVSANPQVREAYLGSEAVVEGAQA
ncbi:MULTISPECIES: ABC transporter ATP-binding protein [Pseudomonas]|jgi:branched-chain amino acid transport system ATP-binding protein|uniref:ABC transporter ATP-binding protein n=1 Tax=Pseudomonas kielensis TaxID=2762577 RepID=A0A7X1KYM8_9PSED|nr:MULTISPECIES: ABC transporter ATP-binding protein [Pseudomonas]MBC2691537.1 ABC transporter ATP-binding protein [Pseudomonas kielensis]NBB33175.1 ATP-binding cassette domain-containing protein [Pseudomonas sp. BC115LW]UZM15046.1 ABC transporter ATP-binding protein [Pseudomonas kielensis]WKL52886.1 ABC transporter ATP-binding protein [Pseudomonas kielensis]